MANEFKDKNFGGKRNDGGQDGDRGPGGRPRGPKEYGNRESGSRGSGDRPRGGKFGPRSGGPGGPGGPGGADGQRLSLAEEIIKLDEDLIRLIARRSKLVDKMRGGKRHAATPKSIKAEKEVRSAWEGQATRFSRDPHFVRQLFNLLQDIEVQTLEEARELGAFKLAPARKPVALNMPAPSSGLYARLWAFLAASTGAATSLQPVQRNDVTSDFVKALNQAGGKMLWSSADCLENQGREPLRMVEQTIYAGEDFFSFCLLAFAALKDPGKVRFTGGSGLKSADLSFLRHFMPSLGARLAHVVPGSNGLPASLECSGELPRSVSLPASFPAEAFVALLLAARSWNIDFTLHYGELAAEAAATALALAAPVCSAAGAEFEVSGTSVHFAAGALLAENFPPAPGQIVDFALGSSLLALPFFTGGTVELAGNWPGYLPQAAVALSMLRQFGMEVSLEGAEGDRAGLVRSAQPKSPLFAETRQDADRLPAQLLPLFLAMLVAAARRNPKGVPYPLLPEDCDLENVRDFFSQFGLEERDGMLVFVEGQEKEAAAAQVYGWTSPGPFWTIAFSLCAFIKPNLKLSNPGSITDLMPGYWAFYNALPDPEILKTPKEASDVKSTRRRFIAE